MPDRIPPHFHPVIRPGTMRIRRLSPVLLLSCVLFIPGGGIANAGDYGPQDFNFANGTTNLGDGTTIASSDGATGSVRNGGLRLSQDGTAGTHASFRVPAIANSSEGWSLEFDFLLEDSPGSSNPADGFSFSYGAIPAYNSGAGAADAAGNGTGEEGWHASIPHISFEIDTWDNGGGESGYNIAVQGADVAFDNRLVLADGQSISGSAEFSWDPVNGASMNLDTGSGMTAVFTNVATPGFTGNDSYSFGFSARTGGATETVIIDNVSIATTTPTLVILPQPVISEFMASNNNTIEDEDCSSPDWIEIFNATAGTVDFDGWYLTNDPANPTMWRIPGLTLAANQRALVFASAKDRALAGAELHTNFKLPKSGGYLALVKPDGATVASAYPAYPAQISDVSYGTLGQEQSIGYFSVPTPGGNNFGTQGAPVAEKALFSLDNSIITSTVSLSLSALSPTATIRYTTNGSDPSVSSTVYSTPLSISNTTRVKARVFENGLQPGPVADRTFVRLSADIQGFSSNLPVVVVDSFGRNIDGESASNSQNPKRPVHAVVFDVDAGTGRASVTDVPDFNGRAGMRVRGQTSSGFAKKQYSLETQDSEGDDKDVSILGFPSESDWILHAPYSDKTLMRNFIVYECSRNLGYPAVRTKFCELFYNANGGNVSMADYRGVYVFMEKIKRDENRVGIKKLDVCNTTPSTISGGYIFKKDKGQTADTTFNTSREGHQMAFVEPDNPNVAQQVWLDSHVDEFENALHGAGFADPATGYAKYIDVRSFVDTHIWVEVFKNIDGYRLSSYFFKDRGRKITSGPVWDYNLSLGNANYLEGQNPTGWYYSLVGGGGYPWYGRLFQDPEFVIRYWDRYFELRQGELSTSRMMGMIDSHTSLLAEAQARNFDRWNILGSYLWPNADGYASRTTHQAEVDWMKTWLSDRFSWIDSQHSRPPQFATPGGAVPAGTQLAMTNPNAGGGTIYYTTNGSDPRLPDTADSGKTVLLNEFAGCKYFVPSGAVNGWQNLNDPANIGSWSTGTTGVGYETTAADYDSLIKSSVPAGTTGFYVRIPFTIASQSVLDGIATLTLNMKYDDGFVAYLNGVKVAGANAPASESWNSLATGQHSDNAAVVFQPVDISSQVGALRVGGNVLAIQGLNTGNTSSDLLVLPQLEGSASGATMSPDAVAYTGPVAINGSGTIRARVLGASGWSPINNETYLVNAVPADASNLVVSEFSYRPGLPSAAESNLGFDARGDFEFIELQNIGGSDIDLAGVRFTLGVEFDFDTGSVRHLAPGQRVVVAKNLDAFRTRYASVLSGVVLAGEFDLDFSNDGEIVTLLAADDSVLRSFTYNDKTPWPEAPDGDGYTLVLVSPSSNPDHTDPLNWRSSVASHGTPGGSDATEFSGDPDGDDNGDGVSNFLHYALAASGSGGAPPALPSAAVEPVLVGGIVTEYLTFSYPRNLAADDVVYLVEISDDLATWLSGSSTVEFMGESNNGDGTATMKFRATAPFAGPGRAFVRLRVSSAVP